MLSKIRTSLANKISFYILLLLFFFLIVLFNIFYIYGKASLEKNTEKRLELASERVRYRTLQFLNNIEKIPENISWMITDYLVHPDSVFHVTKKLIEHNKEILGCFVAFEPGYFSSWGHYHHTPYTYISDSLLISGELTQNDYYVRDWYRSPKKTHKPFWSKSSYGIKEIENTAISYSIPLFNPSNKFIGVLSVALSTQWLYDLLLVNTEYKGSDLIIVNSNGEYVLSGRGVIVKGNEKTIYEIEKEISDLKAPQVIGRIINLEKGEAIINNKDVKSYVSYAPIEGTNWSLAIVIPYEEVYQDMIFFQSLIGFSFLLFLILISGISYIVIKKLTRPIKLLAQSAQAINEDNFNIPIPDTTKEYELKLIYKSFNYMQKKIKKSLENMERTKEASNKIEKDLRLAHNIQMGLLTTDFSYFNHNKHIDFYAVTHPALLVGGDFYDFFIDNDHLCFVIGDVSGKGISGAIMMGVTLSLFRSIFHQDATPSYVANFLNQNLSEYNEASMFVTIFIGKINLKNGLMTYCNAGHPNPILMNADKAISFIKLQSEFPLGINTQYSYKEHKHQFHEKDCLLFYTDGVTDSQNCKKEFFSEERLKKIVCEFKHLPPKGLLDEIVKHIYRYKDKCEQTDDFTLLALALKNFHTDK